MSASLIYSIIASLDGYVADKHEKFDWAEPDEEVHSFANDLERQVDTYLYGRRMYEVMAVWLGSSSPESGVKTNRGMKQRALFGAEGGTTGIDDDFAARGFRDVGAWILGRNMFGPIRGPW